MILCLYILIICGALCVVSAIWSLLKRKRNVLNALILGILLISTGIFPLTQFNIENNRVGLKLLSIGLGLIFAYVAVQSILNNFRCRTIIQAIYLRSNKYLSGKGATLYAPVCGYDYAGKHYELQTTQSFTLKFINENFLEGSPINILIDPNNPEVFIITRRKEILLPIVAIAFIVAGIFL